MGWHCFKFNGQNKSLTYSELMQLAMKTKAENPAEEAELLKLVEELNPAKTSGIESGFYGFILKIIHFFSSSDSMLCSEEIDGVIRNLGAQEIDIIHKSDMSEKLQAVGTDKADAAFKGIINGLFITPYTRLDRFNSEDIKGIIKRVLSKLNVSEMEALQLKSYKLLSEQSAKSYPAFEPKVRELLIKKHYGFQVKDLLPFFKEIRKLAFSAVKFPEYLVKKLNAIFAELIPNSQALNMFKLMDSEDIWKKEENAVSKDTLIVQPMKKEELQNMSIEQLSFMHSIYSSYPGVRVIRTPESVEVIYQKTSEPNKKICTENAQLCISRMLELVAPEKIKDLEPKRAFSVAEILRGHLDRGEKSQDLQEATIRCYIQAIPSGIDACLAAIQNKKYAPTLDNDKRCYLTGLACMASFDSILKLFNSDKAAGMKLFDRIFLYLVGDELKTRKLASLLELSLNQLASLGKDADPKLQSEAQMLIEQVRKRLSSAELKEFDQEYAAYVKQKKAENERELKKITASWPRSFPDPYYKRSDFSQDWDHS